jgi:hypothetical protein
MQHISFWNLVDVCMFWIWFFALVDCLSFEACWTSCNLFLLFLFMREIYFATEACWCKIFAWLDFKYILLLIICFYDHCLLWSFCGCKKMAWWQQELFDGIAQALEDEAIVDLVFNALIYRYQICNNMQEGNMGDPSWVSTQSSSRVRSWP